MRSADTVQPDGRGFDGVGQLARIHAGQPEGLAPIPGVGAQTRPHEFWWRRRDPEYSGEIAPQLGPSAVTPRDPVGSGVEEANCPGLRQRPDQAPVRRTAGVLRPAGHRYR